MIYHLHRKFYNLNEIKFSKIVGVCCCPGLSWLPYRALLYCQINPVEPPSNLATGGCPAAFASDSLTRNILRVVSSRLDTLRPPSHRQRGHRHDGGSLGSLMPCALLGHDGRLCPLRVLPVDQSASTTMQGEVGECW